MKYSLKWIQEHIADPLPSAEVVRSEVTLRAFEVEEMYLTPALSYEERGQSDTIFEIKVLPDRAHDALSHRGMAREIAALLGLQREERREKREVPAPDTSTPSVRVVVEDPALCPRYMGTRVDSVKVTQSPDWLRAKLEAIGQRSINNIVDITNFVLFDIGQPMHAFDAAKVAGGITVRLARAGETMTTLDGKDLTLDGAELVIADDEGVLALAGVKGGKKAEVTAATTSIIVESANFQPTLTRRTGAKHGIRTDASKRYENGITSVFAEEGMRMALVLAKELMPGAKVGRVTDIYHKPEMPYKVGVSASEASRLLGVTLSESDIAGILHRARLSFALVSPREKIAALVESTLEKPYKLGASVLYDAPEYFDCSSLVAWLYKEAGYVVPRISVDQFVHARPIMEKDMLPGDLVFTNSPLVEGNVVHFHSYDWLPNTPVAHGVDHVGVYVGDGHIIHATKWGGRVRKELLATSERFDGSYWCGRIIEGDEKRFVVTVPADRLDLRVAEDLIEEIGRHYGYDKIAAVVPTPARDGVPHKRLFYGNRARKFLVERGFSEVYTYSFTKKGEGDVEVQNPVGKDRPFMRRALATGLARALEENYPRGSLVGIEDIKIFEFGNVFPKEGERMMLALGMMPGSKGKRKTAADDLRTLVNELCAAIGAATPEVKVTIDQQKGTFVWECDFDALTAALPPPHDKGEGWGGGTSVPSALKYQPISPYPFIVRDIALFVPSGTPEDVPAELIRREAGDMVVRFSQFDRFEKDGRTSFAYRLVFQSFDRTLTDDEVNTIMARVTQMCNAKEGWEVR